MKLPTPSPGNRGYEVVIMTTTCRMDGYRSGPPAGGGPLDRSRGNYHEHRIENGNPEPLLRKKDQADKHGGEPEPQQSRRVFQTRRRAPHRGERQHGDDDIRKD